MMTLGAIASWHPQYGGDLVVICLLERCKECVSVVTVINGFSQRDGLLLPSGKSLEVCAYAFFLNIPLASELPHQLHPCCPRPLLIMLLQHADPSFDLVEDGFGYGGYSGLSDVALASHPAVSSVYTVYGSIPAIVLEH